MLLQSCPTPATPWAVGCQSPLSMRFFRQEYWSGLLCPPPGTYFYFFQCLQCLLQALQNLFEFKMGPKAADTTWNINRFGPGTANECIVPWDFKKFFKGDESLENEGHSGWPMQVDSDQLRGLLKLILLQLTTREVAKELRVSHSLIFSHLKLIGKVKKLISGCLMSWSYIKKIVLKCHLLFFAKTMDHFLIRLWCVMKSGFNMTTSKTSSVVRPKEDPKHFQKPSLYQKKVMVSHCLVVCCLSDLLQLSETWWNHFIWEVCLTNQWDALKTAMPAADIGQQDEPNSPWQCPTTCPTTNASKVEWTGLRSFASSAIFTWPSANWLPPFQAPRELFAGKMLPKLAGGRKCFPRVHWVLKHGFLCDRNKPTYFSLAKMLTVMVPILINKDVFEPTVIN